MAHELSPATLAVARRVAAFRVEAEHARAAWIKANHSRAQRAELNAILDKLEEETQLLGSLVADELTY